METSSQLTNESLDAVRIIEAKQRFRVKQIKNCAVLETLYPKYQNRVLTKEQIEQKIIRLAKIDNSIKPVKFEFVIGNWFSFRKNLMKRWIDLEQEKQVLKRIQNKNTVLKENFEDMLEYCGLESEIYKFDEIVNRKIESDNPIFESDDKASLNSFEDDNYLLDPLEFELARQRKVGSRISLDGVYIGSSITINNNCEWRGSRESLNDVFKDNTKLTEDNKKEIYNLSRKQKRRELNIEFLRTHGMNFKRTGTERDNLKKIMKKDRSFKPKKYSKALDKLSEINVNNQIRALLREWILLEIKIINLRCEYFNEDFLGNRYNKVFHKILKDDILKHNARAIYKEATANMTVDRNLKMEEVNKEIFKSIANFKLYDDGLGAETVDNISVSSNSTTGSASSITTMSHARDLNLYDKPKPSSKLQRFRIHLAEQECTIL